MTTRLNNATVVAEGTSTPRSLADRFGDSVCPSDNGADESGSLDSYTALQFTLDNSEDIDLRGKTFRSDSPLVVPTGKHVIIKNGTLDLSRVIEDNLDLLSQVGIGYTNQVSITVDASYPDTTISVVDGGGYSPKDIIQIKSTGAWSKNTTQSEFAVVQSVSGNNITLLGSVLGDYKVTDSAYIRKVDTATGLVLQDVTVIGNPSYSQNGVVLDRCSYSGYTNLRVVDCKRVSYEVSNSIFITGSGSAVFEHSDIEGLGYGLSTVGSQWCNFGDIIGNNCRHVTTSGDSSGSESLARWQTYGNIVGNGCRDAIVDTHDGACDFSYGAILGTLRYGNGADDGVTLEGARFQIGSINISNVERFGININYGGMGDTGRLSFVQINSAAIEGKASGDYSVLVKTDTGITSNRLDTFSIGNLTCNSERGVYIEAANADIGYVDIAGSIESNNDHTFEILSSSTRRVEKVSLRGVLVHNSVNTTHYPILANGTAWSANNGNAVATDVDLHSLTITNGGSAITPIRADSCKVAASNLTLKGSYSSGNYIANGVGTVHFNDSQYGKYKFPYNPSNIPTGNSVSTTVTIDDLKFGDFVQATWDEETFGLYVYGYVSATNTVTVVFRNDTGADVNLGPGNINVAVALG